MWRTDNQGYITNNKGDVAVPFIMRKSDTLQNIDVIEEQIRFVCGYNDILYLICGLRFPYISVRDLNNKRIKEVYIPELTNQLEVFSIRGNLIYASNKKMSLNIWIINLDTFVITTLQHNINIGKDNTLRKIIHIKNEEEILYITTSNVLYKGNLKTNKITELQENIIDKFIKTGYLAKVVDTYRILKEDFGILERSSLGTFINLTADDEIIIKNNNMVTIYDKTFVIKHNITLTKSYKNLIYFNGNIILIHDNSIEIVNAERRGSTLEV